MIKIACIVGARPNFMKSAPLLAELKKHPAVFAPYLIHTGQHYDRRLFQLFFEDLKMPQPDFYLGVGSGSHARQTATIMIRLEKVLKKLKPQLVIVFGDVNSTVAAALVTSKLMIPLAHVEAGLRSFDMSMPEEVNRIVTDRLSDHLFVSEASGLTNLKKEGIDSRRIHFTGNIMIDSLVNNLKVAKKSPILKQLKLKPRKYIALTAHRPANVDDKQTLTRMLEVFHQIGERLPIIFPCHPRTRNNLEKHSLLSYFDNKALRLLEPLGYLDFLKLQSEAFMVLTDSGGVQEETTYLKISCLTMRDNTERPATVRTGTNTIVGTDPDVIYRRAMAILGGRTKSGRIPKYWDGHTAERIVKVLLKLYG